MAEDGDTASKTTGLAGGEEKYGDHGEIEALSDNKKKSKRPVPTGVLVPSLFYEKHRRAYDVIFIVVLPVTILILISMFLGYCLAMVEKDSEIRDNDNVFAEIARNEIINLNSEVVVLDIINDVSDCLDSRPSNIDFDNLKEYLATCPKSAASWNAGRDSFIQTINNRVQEEITQNWISCKNKKHPSESPWDQQQLMWEDWEAARVALETSFLQQGIDESIAYERAIDEATSSKHCSLNTPAGALFWMVIMTTVGYGNVSTDTFGGRMMVYTLGLFSILIFSLVITRASILVMKWSDDFFERKRYLKTLIDGWLAVLLWFVIFWTWIFFVALAYMNMDQSKENDVTFREACWFGFITMTTVGFGDFYPYPEAFRFRHLFFGAYMVMVGFVFLGVFILKLKNMIVNRLKNYERCQRRLNVEDISYGEEQEDDANVSGGDDLSLSSKENMSHDSTSEKKAETKQSNEENPDDDGEMKKVEEETNMNIKASTRGIRRFRRKLPRTYDFVFIVFLPMTLLILSSIFFGHFVGVLERENEIHNNDATFALIHTYVSEAEATATGLLVSFDECIDNRPASIDFDNLDEYLRNCTISTEEYKKLSELATFDVWELWGSYFSDITYNWIKCKNEKYPSGYYWDEVLLMAEDWWTSMVALQTSFLQQGIDENVARERAIDEATSSKHCSVDAQAGALFWLELETTIGYGDITPQTDGGRVMVCTFGFLSIIVFATVVGRASLVVLKISDSFFKRTTYLKRLSDGWFAIIFWLGFFWLWLYCLALLDIAGSKKYANEDLGIGSHTLEDAYWLAYNSMTTIGLGDVRILPENFKYRQLFEFAYIVLLGNIFLMSFIFKLANVMTKSLKNYECCQRRLNVEDISYDEEDDKLEDEDLSLISKEDVI